MRAKETEAISGMHMPSGENLWASPADDCKTPGSKFDIEIHSDEVFGKVKLPFEIELSEEEAKEMEDKIHDALEDILSPFFQKEALGLTGVPAEQQKDYQFEQPFHIKDPQNVGVIDVETVVDAHPMNNSDDSKEEKTMEQLIEDLITQLESRGYSEEASLIKESQSGAMKGALVGGAAGFFTPLMFIPAPIRMALGGAAGAAIGSWLSQDSPQKDELEAQKDKVAALQRQLRDKYGFDAGDLGTLESRGLTKELYQKATKKAGMRVATYELSPEVHTYRKEVAKLSEIFERVSAEAPKQAPTQQGSDVATQHGRGPRLSASKYRFADQDDSKRTGVKKVQAALGGITVDGWWGAKTDEAWKAKYGELPSSLKEALDKVSQKAEEAPEDQVTEEAETVEETQPEAEAQRGEGDVLADIEKLLSDLVTNQARLKGIFGTKHRRVLQRIEHLGGVDEAAKEIVEFAGGTENLVGLSNKRTPNEKGQMMFSPLEQKALGGLMQMVEQRDIRESRRDERRERREERRARRGRAEDGSLERSEARKDRMRTLEKVSRRLT